MLVDNVYREIQNPNNTILTVQNTTDVTMWIKFGTTQPVDDDDKIVLEPITRNNDGTYLLKPTFGGEKAWIRVRNKEALGVGESVEITVTEKVEAYLNGNIGTVNKPYYRKMYLSTNEQILNMAVDGSVTPQRFIIKPNAGEIIRIERIIIIVEDDGNFDAGNWGNGVIMTNGMKAELVQNSIVNDLTGINPIRNTADFAGIMYDLTYHSFGQGNNFIVARFTFSKAGQPLRLVGDNGDEFAVIIRDDLSSLVRQQITAQGSFENESY